MPSDGNCICLKCSALLPLNDIKVQADTALCRVCGTSYRFSDLVHGGGLIPFNPADPPPGASFEQTADGFEVSATTRSWEAVLLLPVIALMSGAAILGTVKTLQGGGIDVWPSIGAAILFLLFASVLWGLALVKAAGRLKVIRLGDSGKIFYGIGSLGWSRAFRWSEVRSVAEASSSFGNRHSRVIALKGDAGHRIREFGTLVTDERRWFIIAALRCELGKTAS